MPDEKIQLTRKTWAVFGYKGGGKSTFAKWIATTYKDKCLYFDTLRECPKEALFHSYIPQNSHTTVELETIIALLKQAKKYRMLIIDEANRFLPPKPHPLPQAVADMNDWCRHPEYNLSVGYIARRPVQINTDITELCDYLFIFQLGGKNDIKYLNDLRQGLGDVVKNLPPFHFVCVSQDRTWKLMRPIHPDKIFIGSDTKVLTH